MSKLIKSSLLYSEIVDILNEPCEYIFLMAPKLEFDRVFLNFLKKLSVPLFFICSSYSQKKLEYITRNIDNVTIFSTCNLSAHIILTDNTGIYINIDFKDYSEYDAHGIGFIVEEQKHSKEYFVLLNIFEKAICDSHCIVEKNHIINNDTAYCIRCRDEIPLVNVTGIRAYKHKPHVVLCRECYNIWKLYKNYEYEEEYCYTCAEYTSTSVGYPLCYSCFRENN